MSLDVRESFAILIHCIFSKAGERVPRPLHTALQWQHPKRYRPYGFPVHRKVEYKGLNVSSSNQRWLDWILWVVWGHGGGPSWGYNRTIRMDCLIWLNELVGNCPRTSFYSTTYGRPYVCGSHHSSIYNHLLPLWKWDGWTTLQGSHTCLSNPSVRMETLSSAMAVGGAKYRMPFKKETCAAVGLWK